MDLIDDKKVNNFLNKHIFSNAIKYINDISDFKENTFEPICIQSDSAFLIRRFVEFIKNKINPNIGKILKINEHKLNSNKNLVFNTKTSSYHIEITPSEHGIYDKNIINEYLYDISSSSNVITSKKKNIIVWSIDNLGIIAQECLQNLILENNQCANFICTSFNESKISPSLKSILNIINIKINRDHLNLYYNEYLKSKINKEEFENIIEKSKMVPDKIDIGYFFHNIFLLENNIESDDMTTYFQKHIVNFYNKIKKIKKIDITFCEYLRNNLYEYYVNHINSSDMLKILIELIITDNELDDNFKKEICDSAIKYDINSKKGNKSVIHLEAFILDFLYKKNSRSNKNKVSKKI